MKLKPSCFATSGRVSEHFYCARYTSATAVHTMRLGWTGSYFGFWVIWSYAEAHQTVWRGQLLVHIDSRIWQVFQQPIGRVEACRSRSDYGKANGMLSRGRGGVLPPSIPLDGDILALHLSTRPTNVRRRREAAHLGVIRRLEEKSQQTEADLRGVEVVTSDFAALSIVSVATTPLAPSQTQLTAHSIILAAHPARSNLALLQHPCTTSCTTEGDLASVSHPHSYISPGPSSHYPPQPASQTVATLRHNGWLRPAIPLRQAHQPK